jgi:hypothetical protein
MINRGKWGLVFSVNVGFGQDEYHRACVFLLGGQILMVFVISFSARLLGFFVKNVVR